MQEAVHRGLGMRVIKDKRVALTSTSDLTPRGIDRFVEDALALVEISQEDPFAGRPPIRRRSRRAPLPELDLYDATNGEISAAEAIALATRGRRRRASVDPRITNSDGATFSRTAGAFALVLSRRVPRRVRGVVWVVGGDAGGR